MTSKKNAHKKHSGDYFVVVVRFLEDDSEEKINVPDDATGKWLFEEACRRQDIVEEKEYFGLRYLERELLSSPTKQWINLSRSVFTQLKNTNPRLVNFRFKHYPASPLADLRLPKTHYLLYHQLRRDLLNGRLADVDEVIVRLAALVLQVELGDSSMQDLPQLSAKSSSPWTYVSAFKVLHNQTAKTETELMKEHEKLEGLLPSEAAMEMIELASGLETYGIDPVRVKTKAFGARPIHLGLTHRGVAEFVSTRRQKLYQWSDISWMTYDGRYFVLAITKASSKKKPTTETVRFKCESRAVARAVWEWASDRQLFMTLERSSSAHPVKSKHGLFSRSHTFKFSGRCRREVLGRRALAATLPSNLGACLSDSTDQFRTPQRSAHDDSRACTMSTLSMSQDISQATNSDRASLDFAPAIRPSPNVTEPLRVEISHSRTSGLTADSHGGFCCSTTASDPAVRDGAGGLLCSPVHDSFSSPGTQLVSGELVSPRLVQADQLVPYFETQPRRRYTPESRDRQEKLVHRFHESGTSPTIGPPDEEEWSTEAAVAELCAAAEAGQAWANQTNGASRQTWTNRVRSPNPDRVAFNSLLPVSHSTPGSDNNNNTKRPKPNLSTIDSVPATPDEPPNSEQRTPGEQSATRWRMLVLSAGLLTGISLIGLTVLFEADLHAPVVSALRGHPWMLDFHTRVYRPIRSAIFGFWRRPQ